MLFILFADCGFRELFFHVSFEGGMLGLIVFVPDYCKTLIIGGYLILAILAVKAKSAKILARKYLIYNTLTSAKLYRGSDKKREPNDYLRYFLYRSMKLYIVASN